MNNEQGVYYYFEASEVPQGSVAELGLRDNVYGPACLNFYRYMWGEVERSDSMSEFRVLLRNNRDVELLYLNGNDVVDAWMSQSVEVSPNEQGQLVFQVTRGSSYKGDVAIDEISLVRGQCAGLGGGRDDNNAGGNNDQNCGEVDIPVCDFETDTLCCGKLEHVYNANSGNDLTLTYWNGTTGSAGTGPNADHTYGTASGHYIYLEVSGTGPNRNAIVKTTRPLPYFGGTDRYNMQFYYHMMGEHIGRLIVRTQPDGQTRLDLSGEQHTDPNWREQLIRDIPAGQEVYIEAHTGTGYLGDIALDDIVFSKVQ